jgi:hypothetical protein
MIRRYLWTLSVVAAMVAWQAWWLLLILPAVWMADRFRAWEDDWAKWESDR